MNLLDLRPLAEKIAQEALESDDPAFRLDCFKALAQHEVGILRVSSRGTKGDDEENVGLSIPEMIARHRDADAQHVRVSELPEIGGRSKEKPWPDKAELERMAKVVNEARGVIEHEKPLVSSARRRASGEARERDRNGKYT